MLSSPAASAGGRGDDEGTAGESAALELDLFANDALLKGSHMMRRRGLSSTPHSRYSDRMARPMDISTR